MTAINALSTLDVSGVIEPVDNNIVSGGMSEVMATNAATNAATRSAAGTSLEKVTQKIGNAAKKQGNLTFKSMRNNFLKQTDTLKQTDSTKAMQETKANTGKQLTLLDTMLPGRDLAAYISAVNGIAILTAEEELELANEYYYQNNLDAARKLVLAHLRFVVHVAKSYSGYGLSESDLIQEGNVGLMKAVKRFNPEVGVRLVSFAVHWIKAEIHEFILRNWRIVKVATTKAQRKLFFNLRGAKKRLGWLSQDEANLVAEDLGVDAATVVQMEGRMGAFDASFDGAADADDEETGQSPAYYLEDSRYDPADSAENDDWEKTSTDGLYVAMSSLDDRSRDILTQRWLNDNKSTLHDLAAKYGVSAERIRQLEKNAMEKVKARMEA